MVAGGGEHDARARPDRRSTRAEHVAQLVARGDVVDVDRRVIEHDLGDRALGRTRAAGQPRCASTRKRCPTAPSSDTRSRAPMTRRASARRRRRRPPATRRPDRRPTRARAAAGRSVPPNRRGTRRRFRIPAGPRARTPRSARREAVDRRARRWRGRVASCRRPGDRRRRAAALNCSTLRFVAEIERHLVGATQQLVTERERVGTSGMGDADDLRAERREREPGERHRPRRAEHHDPRAPSTSRRSVGPRNVRRGGGGRAHRDRRKHPLTCLRVDGFGRRAPRGRRRATAASPRSRPTRSADRDGPSRQPHGAAPAAGAARPRPAAPPDQRQTQSVAQLARPHDARPRPRARARRRRSLALELRRALLEEGGDPLGAVTRGGEQEIQVGFEAMSVGHREVTATQHGLTRGRLRARCTGRKPLRELSRRRAGVSATHREPSELQLA